MDVVRKSNRAGLLLAAIVSLVSTTPVLAQAGNGQGNGHGNDNAQPKCSLVALAKPSQWIVSHDPLTQGGAVDDFELAITNTGTGNCTIKIESDLGGESFGLKNPDDNYRVPYIISIKNPAEDLTPFSGRKSNELTTSAISIKEGATLNLEITVEVYPDRVLRAGLYSQQILLNIDHPGGTSRASVPVVVGLNARSGALMGLKGAVRRIDGLPTIDVGTLTEGERSLNTSLYVVSTSNYSVRVSSENGGYLRQEGTAWSLPYNLKIGEYGVNLANGFDWTKPVPTGAQDEYPLSISVGSLINKRAGTYSDIIRFTLSAL